MSGLERMGSAAAPGLKGLVCWGWGRAGTKQLTGDEGCVCSGSMLVSLAGYATKYLHWCMVFLSFLCLVILPSLWTLCFKYLISVGYLGANKEPETQRQVAVETVGVCARGSWSSNMLLQR